MSTALWPRFHWNSKICLRSVVTLPCIRFSCSELVGPEYASTVTIVKHMFSMHPKPLIQIHLYPDVFPRVISSQKTDLSWLAKCRYQRRFPVWGGLTCPFPFTYLSSLLHLPAVHQSRHLLGTYDVLGIVLALGFKEWIRHTEYLSSRNLYQNGRRKDLRTYLWTGSEPRQLSFT